MLTMVRLGFIICFCFFNLLCFSQETFKVEDFSDRYYGKVYVEDAKEIITPGWIAIYEKGTDKQLLKVESEELVVRYTDKGEVKVNELQLPYGEQSVIIYDDFNFDGIKDFAIEDGQNSCYHGPSFVVYLATKDGKFKYDGDFTELAQYYCGMFDADSDSKLIRTMTKSGCCWHQWNTFDVVNNKPRLIKSREETPVVSGYFMEIKERVLKKNKWIEDVCYTLESEVDTLFSFQLAKNKKTVVLFKKYDALQYVLLENDNRVDFAYPPASVSGIDSLVFEVNRDIFKEKRELLDFSNGYAHYQIYNESDKVGMKVIFKGKEYDLPGDLKTRKGSLGSILLHIKFSNLYFVDNE